MSWEPIPCTGCNTAALLSGTSYRALEARGMIQDGQVVHHLEGCASPAREIVRLRDELAHCQRVRTLVGALAAVSMCGVAFLTGTWHEANVDAERWRQVADLAKSNREMVATVNTNATAMATLVEAAMRANAETDGRMTDVMQVVEAARARLTEVGRKSASP